MIKEILVDSIGQYIDEVFKLDKDQTDELKRLNYTFRGQKSEKYRLSSSLKRIYGSQANYVEKRLLENFKKYGVAINSEIGNSVWKNISTAQHHGIPTRFLDFSYAPLVALHFALLDNEMNENAVVWAINMEIVHNNLIPKKYINILKKFDAYSFTIEMLEELKVTIQDYNYDMKNEGFIFLEPISVDARIVNQWSNFAIIPDELEPLDTFLEDSKFEKLAYKFIIPYDKISRIRKQLDYMGINERILFPDLDGLASYLKRRYM